MKVYEEAIAATSTAIAPWFVIPADKKWFARTAISEIIVNKLETINPQFPQVSKAQRESLLEAKRILESE